MDNRTLASRVVSVRRLALVLAAVMFIMGADLNIVSPFLIDISHSFHVTVSSTGWLVTAFAGGYTLASPVAGWLSDRVGRRITLMVGMLGFVVFETASGLAPTLFVEIVARFLGGVAAGAVSPIAYALVGDWVPKTERPRVMSILSMGFSVSTVAGVPLGLWLASAVGWRGTLLAIGGALSVVGGLLLRSLPHSAPVPTIGSRPPAIHILTRHWPQLSASFWAFAAMGMVYTYLPTALMHRGLPKDPWLMLVLAGYGLCNLAGNGVFGRLGSRRGAAPTVRLAQALELGALILLAFAARTRSLAELVGAAWLFAAGQAYIPDLKALAADVPPAARGTSLAFNNTAMYGGMLAGSALANGLYHLGGLLVVTGSGAIAVLLGILSMALRPSRARQRIQEA